MLVKPTENCMLMLHKLQKYFEEQIAKGSYSEAFTVEFRNNFQLEEAHNVTFLNKNYASLLFLGVLVDEEDFEKNVKEIEKSIESKIKEKYECIKEFEKVLVQLRQEQDEGLLSNEFIVQLDSLVSEVEDWKEHYTHRLPGLVSLLKKGDKKNYKIIKEDIEDGIRNYEEELSGKSLYKKVKEWLNSPQTAKQFGPKRYQAMLEKFALRDNDLLGGWFGPYSEIKDFEQACKFFSEVFYPDQEDFYKKLENWAKNDIEDKDCAQWISSYLWEGRTIPIKQVKVLRYKNDFDKAKKFLLDKYCQKTRWDIEKKSKYTSIFDKFDRKRNSFDVLLETFEKEYPIYPILVCTNIQNEELYKYIGFSLNKGFYLCNDGIHYSIYVDELTFKLSNKFYYKYSSKYKKNSTIYTIYTKDGFRLIVKYLNAIGLSYLLNENIIGCMTFIDNSNSVNPKCATFLLSKSKPVTEQQKAIVCSYLTNREFNLCKNGLQNSIGLRLFVNAALWSVAGCILDIKECSLDLPSTDDVYEKIYDYINAHYDSFSYEEKCLCHFLHTSMYKFPGEAQETKTLARQSMVINLYNCITNHYNSAVFQDENFQWGKIVYQYKNSEFNDLVEKVGGYFNRSIDRVNWLLITNDTSLYYLRSLLFLNWAFICNETGVIKKVSAAWLYYVLFKANKEGYIKDRRFYSSLLYYILIQNEKIFILYIDEIKRRKPENKINLFSSESLLYSIIGFYSNKFKGWGKELNYSCRSYLSKDIKNNTLLKSYKKQHPFFASESIPDIELYAETLYQYFADIIENDSYDKANLLEPVKNMENLPIPYNFEYHPDHHNSSYHEYNGDYSGTYAHDEMEYSNDDIDTIFDGNPEAYWNID